MTFKILVLFILIVIFLSLGSALLQLLRAKGDSRKMAKALTVRIGLSIALFVLLLIAYGLGWITPHGVLPPTQG